ncbi:transporter substrate-binding domain-containing protein [Staphylococcus aureus]|nr:transporter substrate-binding domain-containing protein [Staphylococcus aureus]
MGTIRLKDKEASKDSKTINVGTEGTYAPFSFHDKDGKLTGYDIDVIKAVAKAEGLKLKFNETSWDSDVCRFRRRRFDVIANQVGINPDREKEI